MNINLKNCLTHEKERGAVLIISLTMLMSADESSNVEVVKKKKKKKKKTVAKITSPPIK